QERPAPERPLGRVHAQGDEVIQRRGNDDDEGEPLVPARVEVEAGDQEEPDAEPMPADRPVEAKYAQEEDQELLRTEQHGVPGLVAERNSRGAIASGPLLPADSGATLIGGKCNRGANWVKLSWAALATKPGEALYRAGWCSKPAPGCAHGTNRSR